MPDLVFHSDRRSEAAEKEAVRLQYPPSPAQHGVEAIVIAREVKYCTAENYVGEMVRKGHSFQGFHAEIVHGEGRRQGRGENARGRDGLRLCVHAKDFISRGEKVMKISTETAARIEDFHARRNAAAQELIEQVDIDLAELRA